MAKHDLGTAERQAALVRRPGGRRAQRLARAQKGERMAVRPGLPGGAYRPLSDHDMRRIHRTALKVLENIGVADPIPLVRERALDKGCWIDDQGRLHFPAALVEDVIAGASHTAVLHGRDPRHDIELKGTDVFYAPGAEAINTLDFETGRYRPSTLVDLYDFARLVDQLEQVHAFSRVSVATEIRDLFEFDLGIAYASIAGTAKHVELGFSNGENLERAIPMLDMIAGGEGEFAKRPFASTFACPVVSPLTYGADNCSTCVSGIKLNAPVNVVMGAQAGATAPAALAGTLVQVIAETLAALLMINLVRPGHPVIFGPWVLTSDLRTAAAIGGGGEQAVMSAAAAQVGNFYDFPTSISAGISDSKTIDAQIGFEKGVTTALAALAGANLVTEVCGMTASLLGCSFEAMAVDNEILGVIQRALRGIEVTDETLSYEVIEEVVLNGPKHYLTHPQTLEMMETEFLYPQLADRSSPDAWTEDGCLDIKDRAREKVREILSSHYPEYIDPKTDEAIRQRFSIRLPKEAMRADCGRW